MTQNPITNLSLNYGQACGEATKLAMRRNKRVFVYGLGVDDPKGMYGTTKGLLEEFGKDRCFDTPLSEDAMTGFGIGMAMSGYRPIHVHQRFDFLLLCMNQLINMAAKVKYLSNGSLNCPIIVRAIIGRSWGQGAQHSQSFHSFLASIPGLEVVAPVTPHDIFNTMIWATTQSNPVIMTEHRMLYKSKGFVSEDINYSPGIRVLSKGNDITICSLLHSTLEASRAVNALNDNKVNVDHLNINRLNGIDYETIYNSVQRTGKLLVIDNGWLGSSIASDIVANMAVRGFQGDAQMLGYQNCPCPTPRKMEDHYYPGSKQIANIACKMLNINHPIATKTGDEIETFRGPF